VGLSVGVGVGACVGAGVGATVGEGVGARVSVGEATATCDATSVGAAVALGVVADPQAATKMAALRTATMEALGLTGGRLKSGSSSGRWAHARIPSRVRRGPPISRGGRATGGSGWER